MTMTLLVRVGLWIAGLGGWQPCQRPHLPADSQIDLARAICQQVEDKHGRAPSELKRREALRMLLNVIPESRAKDLNLLIELALQ